MALELLFWAIVCSILMIHGIEGSRSINTAFCTPGQIIASSNNSLCEPCPAGSYSIDINATACWKCEPGRYSKMQGQTLCTRCQKGLYAAGRGNTRCEECSPGRFADDPGSYTCFNCHPGRYAADKGMISCHECREGEIPVGPIDPSFRPGFGQTGCEACPPGTYSDGIYCDNCLRGQYSQGRGQTACKDCPAGTFQFDKKDRHAIEQCPQRSYDIMPLSDEIKECAQSMRRSSWKGDKKKTLSGEKCRDWSEAEGKIPTMDRNQSANFKAAAGNSCQNPDGDFRGPWCFYLRKNPDGRFFEAEYCFTAAQALKYCATEYYTYLKTVFSKLKRGIDNICEDGSQNCAPCWDARDAGGTGSYYLGDRSETVKGDKCDFWPMYDLGNKKTTSAVSAFSSRKGKKENYCRNPDGSKKGPWCYTNVEKDKWEYCFSKKEIQARTCNSTQLKQVRQTFREVITSSREALGQEGLLKAP